jgi:hypothetical protein
MNIPIVESPVMIAMPFSKTGTLRSQSSRDRQTTNPPFIPWRWALLMLAAQGIAGNYFDFILQHIHDHGDNPERSFFLLVPVFFAAIFTWKQQKYFAHRGWRLSALGFLGSAILAMLFLFFPSANYYGSSRALLIGGLVCWSSFPLWLLRTVGKHTRSRLSFMLYWLVPLALLGSYYPLARIGGEQGGSACYVLSYSGYLHHATVISVAAVVVGWLLLRSKLSRWNQVGWLLALLAHLFMSVGELYTHPWAVLVLWVAPIAIVLKQSFQWNMLLPSSLLILNILYTPASAAAIMCLVVAICCALEVVSKAIIVQQNRYVTNHIVFAIGAYLLLWPTVGFRFSGIDFAFMFRWVPIELYEQFWWVIALGMVAKFLFPWVLLFGASASLWPPLSRTRTFAHLLGFKVLLLSAFASGYALTHRFVSAVAIDILSELGLLLVVTVMLTLMTRPWFRRLSQSNPTQLPLGFRKS